MTAFTAPPRIDAGDAFDPSHTRSGTTARTTAIENQRFGVLSPWRTAIAAQSVIGALLNMLQFPVIPL